MRLEVLDLSTGARRSCGDNPSIASHAKSVCSSRDSRGVPVCSPCERTHARHSDSRARQNLCPLTGSVRSGYCSSRNVQQRDHAHSLVLAEVCRISAHGRSTASACFAALPFGWPIATLHAFSHGRSNISLSFSSQLQFSVSFRLYPSARGLATVQRLAASDQPCGNGITVPPRDHDCLPFIAFYPTRATAARPYDASNSPTAATRASLNSYSVGPA